MKVGTDAMLLGAWTQPRAGRILDLGTGTGILALMMAQRTPEAQIDALEIEAMAAKQAQENVASSPWKERIQVAHQAVQNWLPGYQYDLIICNPPYFSQALSTGQPARDLARQTHTLSHTQLLEEAQRLLKPRGHLSLVLPLIQAQNFDILAQGLAQMTLKRRCLIRHSPEHAVSRCLMEWQEGVFNHTVHTEILDLKDGEEYSQQYRKLTAGYPLGSPYAPAADL